MFQNTSMPGMDFGFPDTCWTPGILAGAPGPLPYPNIATHAAGVPSQFKMLVMCMPAHNIGTIIPLSNGDEGRLQPGRRCIMPAHGDVNQYKVQCKGP